MRLGLIPSILTAIRYEEIPICSACCFGKKGFTYPEIDGSGAGIADEHDQPGMCISTNKIKSPQSGLIPVLKGKQTSRNYHVGSIFVDNFSKVTYVHCSESSTVNKFAKAKHTFEEYAAKFGVKIQKYHAEHGAFNTQVFKESIITVNQTIFFSGVDAQHQNKIAERTTKTVTYREHSMIINEMICWTDVITIKLWP